MASWSFIILSLFISGGFCVLRVDELIFPIIDSRELELIKNWDSKLKIQHPVAHDIERVRNLNFYKQNYRLANYDTLQSKDDYNDEFESHHLLALDFIGIVNQYNKNYTAEEHKVQTEDGHNLILHRISGSPEYPPSPGKPVVFIQHGLFLSSDAYVLNGPDKDLAFILVNNGFDVWLGNARGNTYSRSHRTFAVNNTNFWDFTFHDVGVYDLPASIDYVLKETSSSTLTFIGYSIGATESYVLLSEKPEYNKKINRLIGIAPLGFFHPLLQGSQSYNDVTIIYREMERRLRNKNVGEAYPQSSYMQFFAFRICGVKSVNLPSCKKVFDSFFGETDFEPEFVSAFNFLSHVPAGTSVRTILHLFQTMVAGRLVKFQPMNDYRLVVPLQFYDLTKITTPIAIFTADKEQFLQEKDVYFKGSFSDNLVIHKLKNPDSNDTLRSLDFPLTTNAKLINKSIVGKLKEILK